MFSTPNRWANQHCVMACNYLLASAVDEEEDELELMMSSDAQLSSDDMDISSNSSNDIYGYLVNLMHVVM
jgi:hypothetical protein